MELNRDGGNWKTCHDSDRELYTEELWRNGCNELCEIEIKKEIYYGLISLPAAAEEEAGMMIRQGRGCLKNVCDRSGPLHSVILDSDDKICVPGCEWCRAHTSGAKR